MKHFFFLPLVCLFFASTAFGQQAQKPTQRIEYSLLPFIAINYSHLGYSIKTNDQKEHALYLTLSQSLFHFEWDLNLSYNYNLYFKNQILYIPLWCRAGVIDGNGGFEEGYFPNRFLLSLGSGLGALIPLKERLSFRTELGFGAAFSLTNNDPGLYNIQDYSVDERYPSNYPPFIKTGRFKIGLSYLLGKQ